MLAALLCNLPEETADVVTSSGPDLGYTRRAASTSWNPNWSKQYGPEAQAKKTDKVLIEKAQKTIKEAEYVPPALEEIKETIHARSLVDELTTPQADTDYTLVYLLESYFYFCDWRKKDEEDIATILLMME